MDSRGGPLFGQDSWGQRLGKYDLSRLNPGQVPYADCAFLRRPRGFHHRGPLRFIKRVYGVPAKIAIILSLGDHSDVRIFESSRKSEKR